MKTQTAIARTYSMTATTERVTEINRQLEVLNGFMVSTRIPGVLGLAHRSVAKASIDLEIYVQALLKDPPVFSSNVDSMINEQIKNTQDQARNWSSMGE